MLWQIVACYLIYDLWCSSCLMIQLYQPSQKGKLNVSLFYFSRGYWSIVWRFIYASLCVVVFSIHLACISQALLQLLPQVRRHFICDWAMLIMYMIRIYCSLFALLLINFIPSIDMPLMIHRQVLTRKFWLWQITDVGSMMTVE